MSNLFAELITPPAGTPALKVVRFGWLLVAAALLTITIKTAAWLVTGSVGLLSDALESLVNLAAAFLTLSMLSIAQRPPDELHAYGHGKAEYFASGAEGALIVVSALGIVWASIPRLIAPEPLTRVDTGLIFAGAAALINLAVARILLNAASRNRSASLHAAAKHLLTDFWTTAAVIAGIALVPLTGFQRLDPLLALMVAANIVRTGFHLLQESALGLMDTAIPLADREALEEVLRSHMGPEVEYHALRTRQAGARKFASVHILVPGEWSVARGHDLLEEIEAAVRTAVPGVHILTHLESRDDPAAFDDMGLDRTPPG